jgi:dihydroxy-acid dehydratase
LRIAEETGRAAVALIRSGHRPSQIINDQAMENAIRVLLAIGGSTNAVIHLAAIAGRLGLSFDLKRLNELSDTTPVIVNLKPTGLQYMEDLAAAGGIPAVMRELLKLLHLDCITVTGETIGERLAAWNTWVDRSVIHSIDEPLLPDGGLAILFGNLAPGGAVIKRSAADPQLFEQEGRASSSHRSMIWLPESTTLTWMSRLTTFWCLKMPGREVPLRCPRRAICRSQKSWAVWVSKIWCAYPMPG